MDKNNRPWHTEPPPRPGWYEADFGDYRIFDLWLAPVGEDSITWADYESDPGEDVTLSCKQGYTFRWRSLDPAKVVKDLEEENKRHALEVQRNLDIIPSAFRSLRNDCHLTQKQVADAAGVSVPMISQIENGSGLPGLEALGRIAEFLGSYEEESNED